MDDSTELVIPLLQDDRVAPHKAKLEKFLVDKSKAYNSEPSVVTSAVNEDDKTLTLDQMAAQALLAGMFIMVVMYCTESKIVLYVYICFS